MTTPPRGFATLLITPGLLVELFKSFSEWSGDIGELPAPLLRTIRSEPKP